MLLLELAVCALCHFLEYGVRTLSATQEFLNDKLIEIKLYPDRKSMEYVAILKLHLLTNTIKIDLTKEMYERHECLREKIRGTCSRREMLIRVYLHLHLHEKPPTLPEMESRELVQRVLPRLAGLVRHRFETHLPTDFV